MVKTLLLGDQKVSVPGFGAMGLNSAMGTDLNLEQSEPVLLKAVELGCTFWDTAVSCPFQVQERHLSPIALTANLGRLQEWRKREAAWRFHKEVQYP
jgi:aryl-alcohol dehydrogenase-like predicted oxidoreductase